MEEQSSRSGASGADAAAPLGKCCLFGGPYAATRELFIRGLSACYFAAFASFLVQVPGLYGPQGLAPAQDPESLERSCLWGLGVSALGLVGFGNMPVMWSLVLLYGSLVTKAPDPFYNFQWDILLLEAGFLGAVLAPLVHSSLEPRPSRAVLWMLRLVLFKLMLMSGIVKITEGDRSWTDLTAIWYHFATQCIPTPLAWFFHNLPMGLEKLFCACCFAIEIPAAFLILVPVWHVQVAAAFLQVMLQLVIIVTGNYTFFNYLTIFISCTLLDHDAIPWCCRPAEPYPAPLAYVLGLGTGKSQAQEALADDGASKLLSHDSPAAVDTSPLLAPTAAVSRGPDPPGGSSSSSGSTGGSGSGSSGSGGSRGEGGGAARPAGVWGEVAAAVASQGSAEGALKQRAVQQLGLPPAAQHWAWLVFGWCSLGLCGVLVFWYSVALGLNSNLAVHMRPSDLMNWASLWVPRALVLVSLVIPVVTFFDVLDAALVDTPALLESFRDRGQRRPAWVSFGGLALAAMAVGQLLFRAAVCQRYLSLMPGPMVEVAPGLKDPHTRTSLWWNSRRLPGQETTMPLGLPHFGPYPYGLFRSMTGIGPDGNVARPEVIIQVQEAASGKWQELQFRYKPGDVSRRPPIIAPYQPRLDWQMWFQALSPFPDDWFERLLQQIKEGSPAVLSLLDVSTLPDTEVSSVRAALFNYNFTAYGQSAWWRRTEHDPRFVPAQKFQRPVNLARAAATQPHDWRTPAVWAFLGVALLLWLATLGLRLGLAWAQRRPVWWQPGAAGVERKDA